MGKNKLARFAENKILPNVVQPTREEALNGFELKETGEKISSKMKILLF
jgi:tRNA (guanine-N7-)-methyltransferase